MPVTPADRARDRDRYLNGLMWHIGAFAVLNAFFWVLDAAVGEMGVQWAYWITLVWGLVLAFHVVAYLIVGRQVAERGERRYVAEEEGGPDGPW